MKLLIAISVVFLIFLIHWNDNQKNNSASKMQPNAMVEKVVSLTIKNNEIHLEDLVKYFEENGLKIN